MEFLGYCPYQELTTFGDYLKAMRIYRFGWSQKEMAQEIGIDEGTLQRWERGWHGKVFAGVRRKFETFFRSHGCDVEWWFEKS